MAERKRITRQETIYKSLHRKLKIEQLKPEYNLVIKSGDADWKALPAPHVAPVVSFLLQTQCLFTNKMKYIIEIYT